MAAVIFGILAVLVSHSMGRWGRALVYGMCGSIVVAIGYSRVYLGAHWLSDMLAGLFFGTVVVAAFGVAIEAIPPRRIRPLSLFGVSLIVFILAGAAHVTLRYERAQEIYAMPQRHILIQTADWLSDGWEKMPPQRIDLAGKPEESFIAQYAGDLAPLDGWLKQGGWTEVPHWTWRESLPYLNPNAKLAELPPRPALHEGLQARLTFMRPVTDGTDERQVLRVYKTEYAAAEGTSYKPIYLVSLTREVQSSGFHLYAIPSLLPPEATDVAAFRDGLSGAKALAKLAERDRAGTLQDLIAATP